MMMCFILMVVFLAFTTGSACAGGSGSDDGPEDETVSLPIPLPHIGFLVLPQAIFSDTERPDGFVLRAARLRLRGTAGDVLQYFVQIETARTVPVLDARLGLRLTRHLHLDAGLFKTPFSREQLAFFGAVPLAERSQVVRALAPGRQLGVQVRADALSGRVSLYAGVFNGNGGQVQRNDDDRFLYVARVELGERLLGSGFGLGANVAYSTDSGVTLPGHPAPFHGDRVLWGVDAEYTSERVLITGELIGGRIDPVDASATYPLGYYLTAGYTIARRHQLLAGFDGFDSDLPGGPTLSRAVVLGYNLFLNPYTRILANYTVPLEKTGAEMLIVRLQFAVR